MNNMSSSRVFFVFVAGFIFLTTLPTSSSHAQTADTGEQSTEWAAPAISAAQRMRMFPDPSQSVQQAPPVIPELETDRDPSGLISSYQPGGATLTSRNPFFQNLGTNGRTCFTCHQPQNGWTISAQAAHDRFFASNGTDPLFRLVDGATCPSDDVSTPAAQQKAYQLLIDKGLIRIGLAIPSNAKFTVSVLSDPYGCNTNPTTGLTSPTSGIVSVYRRPLPSTNLGFLSTVMWDGREPSLAHQAVDATLTHAQGNNPGPTTAQQTQIVNFESGIFTSQIFDNQATLLLARPTQLTQTVPIAGTNPVQCTETSVAQSGGPFALAALLPEFFIGVNDPFGLNPCGTPFTGDIFDLYANWANLPGNDPVSSFRKSVARGEEVFNTKPINITGVAGINDVLNQPSFIGNCGTCHDTPNIGDHSVKAPLDIGITDANPVQPLDVSGLPVFAVTCTDPNSPLLGKTFNVTDPGRALISGNCTDIGKTKGPILRGLAARAPYFHNGSAATLSDAVEFYEQRFNVGFTDQEKQDLANFLATL
jgi:cytochrome c peroxidase